MESTTTVAAVFDRWDVLLGEHSRTAVNQPSGSAIKAIS